MAHSHCFCVSLNFVSYIFEVNNLPILNHVRRVSQGWQIFPVSELKLIDDNFILPSIYKHVFCLYIYFYNFINDFSHLVFTILH